MKNSLLSKKSIVFRLKLTTTLSVKKRRRLLRGKKTATLIKNILMSATRSYRRILTLTHNRMSKFSHTTNANRLVNSAKLLRYSHSVYKTHNSALKAQVTANNNAEVKLNTSDLDNVRLPALNSLVSTISVYHSKNVQAINSHFSKLNLNPMPGCFDFKINTFRPILTRQLNFHSDVTP